MIGDRRVLGVIPARGGSKGVPRKNIRRVGGKPLIAWTIDEAVKSCYLDRVVLSTDDEEIAAIAREYGCEVPFLRPPQLALDDTPGIDTVLHALEVLPDQYDVVVLLQPTSPLRNAEDIDRCLEALVEHDARACVSVVQPQKNPYWMYSVDGAGHLAPLLPGSYSRRQDLPQVYALNGAVYAAEVDWLKRTRAFVTGETKAYEMPQERSLDIDTEWDLACFEVVAQLKTDKGPRICVFC